MKSRHLKSFTAVSMVLAAASANAGDNPFQMIEFGGATTVATDAVDMQGNKIKINDETGFTYGGDDMAKYAGGKIATGAKDPAVCGTFSSASCSMPHTSMEAKAKGAAMDAAGKVMDKAKDMMK